MHSCAEWRGDGTREWAIANNQYDEGEITEVAVGEESIGIGCKGWGYGGYPVTAPLPKVGDTIRTYGGWGRQICGADLNGEPAYWITIEEMDATNAKRSADYHAKQETDFIAGQARLDADYDSLPSELQKRIDQLREAGGRKWRVEGESYEMFVCTQAVVIASLGSEEAIRRWNSINSDTPPEGYEKYDYKRQVAELPGYDDGHSGNTHGVAVALAIMLVNGQRERAAVMPAALSPISGDPRYSD